MSTAGTVVAGQLEKAHDTYAREGGVDERILIVDDDQTVTGSVAEFLQREGYPIAVVPTGQEALRMVRETPVCLVLLSLRLPDTDGAEVLRQTQRLTAPPEVILLSGPDTARLVQKAIEYYPQPPEFAEASA